jgi:hypothetical protein
MLQINGLLNAQWLCLEAIARIHLGEALAFPNGEELELGLLVNVQPGMGVVLAIPSHIWSTSETGEIPASATNSDAKNRIDRDNLDTEPGLEEGGCLLGSVNGSSRHDDGEEEEEEGERGGVCW